MNHADLKARWIIYFDLMDMECEVEQQTFTLNSGTEFTPTIHLPEFDTYAFVKYRAGLTCENFDNLFQFALKFQKPIILLDDRPMLSTYEMTLAVKNGPNLNIEIEDVNMIVDANNNLVKGLYLDGEDNFKAHGYEKAIQPVKKTQKN